MFGNIGPLEIGIVLLIALLIFGSKKLPGLGKDLGTGLREFKETVTDEQGSHVLEDRPTTTKSGGPE